MRFKTCGARGRCKGDCFKVAGKAWCAGADLGEMLKLTAASAAVGIEMLTLFWGTAEAREGMLAFNEKREPNFRI